MVNFGYCIGIISKKLASDFANFRALLVAQSYFLTITIDLGRLRNISKRVKQRMSLPEKGSLPSEGIQ